MLLIYAMYLYRCSKRKTEKCSGLLRQERESYILERLHNHSDEPYIVQIFNIKKEMIRLTVETTKPLKEIFDTVCRSNPTAAAYISYNSMKSVLSRQRTKSRPAVPNDLRSLHDMLETYEPTRSIYKGCAVSSNNKIALIFSSDTLLSLLSEACEIFVDGTFSIVPKKPNMSQLYSVHVRHADTGIATIFVLCEVRSTSLYKAMWEKIVSLAPDLQRNLKVIMSDYEKAALSAMSQQFPTASIYGCWFHYTQAILRKWRKLQLNSAPHDLLSMAMSMALAPSNLFDDSLNIMQTLADRMSTTYPNVLLFMTYMRSTWLPLASKVSVHNCRVRTNNVVESFHHVITQKIGTVNPNLWIFLEHLSDIIRNQEIDYSRLQNNISIRRLRTRFNRDKNAKIIQGQNALTNGDISLQQFLRMFSRFNQHHSEILLEDNDDVEIDATLLSDEILEAETQDTSNLNQRRGTNRSRRNTLVQREMDRQEDIEVQQLYSLNSTENFGAEHNTNNEFTTNTQDEEIFRIPEDDYSYLDETSSAPEVFHEIHTVHEIIDNNRSPRVEGTCIICINERASYVFVPCGHLCSCENCYSNLVHRRCPMCNLQYDNCIRTISS